MPGDIPLGIFICKSALSTWYDPVRTSSPTKRRRSKDDQESASDAFRHVQLLGHLGQTASTASLS
jgi:hypothetical protein